MMFAEGESELRDLVVQNLESCGFLNKIKAELRAGVFLALSEEESLKKKVFNKKLDDFVSTNDGKFALSIVREFLEYFNLNFTLSVFDPEISSVTPYANRKSLCEELELNELEGPVLLSLLKKKVMKNLCDLDLPTTETEKSFSNKINEKNVLNNFDSAEQKKNFLEETGKIFLHETNKSSKLTDSPFSLNKVGNSRNFFNFSEPEDKDIFKDQTVDNFFDDPVPSEKPEFLNLSDAQTDKKEVSSRLTILGNESSSVPNDQKKLSTLITPEKSTSTLNDPKKVSSSFLPSETSLSSLRDLPSLTKQDNSKHKELSLGSDLKEDLQKADADTESNEEFSERQNNSEESIEEEIEEEFSAGLDDLLNSSLSLGDDATSDQTISQASVVDGVDHIEPCNLK